MRNGERENGLDRTDVKRKMTMGHCNGHELFQGTKYSSDDTCISMLPAAVQQSRRLAIWVMFASLTIFRYFGPLPIEREMYEYLCFQIRTQDMRKCARADEKWKTQCVDTQSTAIQFTPTGLWCSFKKKTRACRRQNLGKKSYALQTLLQSIAQEEPTSQKKARLPKRPKWKW